MSGRTSLKTYTSVKSGTNGVFIPSILHVLGDTHSEEQDWGCESLCLAGETASPRVSLWLTPGISGSPLQISSPPDCSGLGERLGFTFIYLGEDDLMGNC